MATAGGASPVSESGASTPNFFNNPPPVNTTFPLITLGMAISPTTNTIKDANITGGTVTYQGVATSGGKSYPLFELKIPSLGLDASNLTGSGTPATQPNGNRVNIVSGVLNYASLGVWGDFPSDNTSTGYLGEAVTGFQTQPAHVPTSGSATYSGLNGSVQGSTKAGGVVGQIYVPNSAGTGVGGGVVFGDATVNIDFASGGVTGVLGNMYSSSTPTGTARWNTVNLSGSLSGSNLSGTTTTTAGPPPDAGLLGMSAAATGKFNGALYGPNVNEVGAVWSLYESTSNGGKAVVGTIGATKQ